MRLIDDICSESELDDVDMSYQQAGDQPFLRNMASAPSTVATTLTSTVWDLRASPPRESTTQERQAYRLQLLE